MVAGRDSDTAEVNQLKEDISLLSLSLEESMQVIDQLRQALTVRDRDYTALKKSFANIAV